MSTIPHGYSPIYINQNSSQTDYQARLAEAEMMARRANPSQSQNPLWDSIDSEIAPLSDLEKETLAKDAEYAANTDAINALLAAQLLQQMKPLVERTEAGQELLKKQLEIVSRLKKSAVESTTNELAEFRAYQEYSKKHPKATLQDFKNTKK